MSEPSPASGRSSPMQLWAQGPASPSLGTAMGKRGQIGAAGCGEQAHHAGPSLWMPQPAPGHPLYDTHPTSNTDQV